MQCQRARGPSSSFYPVNVSVNTPLQEAAGCMPASACAHVTCAHSMVSAFLVYACCVSFMLHGMRWRSLRRFLRIADFDGSQKRHMRPPAAAMMHAHHSSCHERCSCCMPAACHAGYARRASAREAGIRLDLGCAPACSAAQMCA